MHAARTLHSLHTASNADSVEFIPDDEEGAEAEGTHDECAARRRTFVCGNYQLDELTRVKSGRIYLYQLADASEAAGGEAAAASTSSASSASSARPAPLAALPLIEHAALTTAAIFDLKWCPKLVYGKRILGQVDADGQLLLYRYEHARAGAPSASLTLEHTQQVTTKSASCLSLDWNNRIHAQ
jgi:hypothetical protein